MAEAGRVAHAAEAAGRGARVLPAGDRPGSFRPEEPGAGAVASPRPGGLGSGAGSHARRPGGGLSRCVAIRLFARTAACPARSGRRVAEAGRRHVRAVAMAARAVRPAARAARNGRHRPAAARGLPVDRLPQPRRLVPVARGDRRARSGAGRSVPLFVWPAHGRCLAPRSDRRGRPLRRRPATRRPRRGGADRERSHRRAGGPQRVHPARASGHPRPPSRAGHRRMDRLHRHDGRAAPGRLRDR